MAGDVLHPAKNLRGRPEVVWKDVFDDEEIGGDDDGAGGVPWASWGMRSVKATKWEDLIKEESSSKTSKKSSKQSKASPSKPEPPPTKSEPIVAQLPKSPAKALTMTPGPLRRSIERTSLEQAVAELLSTPSRTYGGGAYITAEGEKEPSPNADRQAKPAGIAWEQPSPWSMVQRISKQKLFAIDMDAFDGEGAKQAQA
ncbi:hypothetical protein M408DRAFT_334047 [Serendipita vermifera MAFF 305830]|uniref:Uncharacterized protein n=1 Tax=Serendipita vermifera MAFF 305830 TaxID=933852 RepID=A0A0C3A6M6_SERVB|nr:hypothetical protein M408DRAFT_334047 [Serendipita vermifera MAFF 305830]